MARCGYEVMRPLPEVWLSGLRYHDGKCVPLPAMFRGYEAIKYLRLSAETPEGTRLCTWCLAAPTDKKTSFYCSDSCRYAWKQFTWNFLKEMIFQRDGVCQICGTGSFDDREQMITKRVCHRWDAKRGGWVERVHLPKDQHKKIVKCGYEIDHITPRVLSGIEFDPRNLRLLCVPCHQRETARLAKFRAEQRRGQIRLAV